MKKELQKQSKFLSKILRHDPESVGIVLDKNGWANVSDIKKILKVNQEELNEIVETNDKKRFEFDTFKSRIRARQGHSIEVDVELQIYVPTGFLYHGTAFRFINNIMKQGLNKQNRQHVHLSDNEETARRVGSRHGQSVILQIDSAKMHEDGLVFYKSNNDVYLTDNVPSEYITIKN